MSLVNSILVEWTSEVDNIDGYIIKYTQNNDNVTVDNSTQTSTTLNLTTLPLLNEYNIRVAAYNEYGTGNYSDSIIIAQVSVTSRTVRASTTEIVSEFECTAIRDEPIDTNSTVFTVDSLYTYMATGTKRNMTFSGMNVTVECSFSINGVNLSSSSKIVEGNVYYIYIYYIAWEKLGKQTCFV